MVTGIFSWKSLIWGPVSLSL